MFYQVLTAFSFLGYIPLIFQCLLVYCTGAKIINICGNIDRGLEKTYTSVCNTIIFNTSFVVTDQKNYKSGFIICRSKNLFGIGNISVTPAHTNSIGGSISTAVSCVVLHWGTFEVSNTKITDIDLYGRGHSMRYFRCDRRITPLDWQRKLGDIITNRLDQSRAKKESTTIVCLLCGAPGIGKTTFGLYMAQKTGWERWVNVAPSVLCRSGDVARQCAVVQADEADTVFETDMRISDIPDGGISHILKSDRDKVSKNEWNTELDSLRYGANLILILTSNLTYNEIHQKFKNIGNEACLREGRIDLFIDIEDGEVKVRGPIVKLGLQR